MTNFHIQNSFMTILFNFHHLFIYLFLYEEDNDEYDENNDHPTVLHQLQMQFVTEIYAYLNLVTKTFISTSKSKLRQKLKRGQNEGYQTL